MTQLGLEIRAFGGLSISHHGVQAQVGSRQRRVLLALLLAHRGTVVPVTRLADALWREGQPATAAKSLQVQVHRLRRILGDEAALRHLPPGYLLAIPDECVDLYRFVKLIDRGRAAMSSGDATGATGCFRTALALYRGPAFEGLEDIDALAIESRRFAELRLAAAEDRFAAELATGGHAGLVPELEVLATLHPLRERFRAQLMTALYRSGRKADALAIYRAGRDLLAAELGVEPNEECRALHQAILADDPALSVSLPQIESVPVIGKSGRPRQLLPDVTHFTGRIAQLQWLDELPAGGTGPTHLLAVVDGQAGVGKTTLVTHWAHRRSDWFADGQLYVNLRGHAVGAPMRQIEALSQLLRALGASDDQLSGEVDEAAAQLRSMLAEKRVLLVLDDAADADQVRPLLPGVGACLTVVTSRNQLPGLVARDGARRLRLDLLSSDEAVDLLTNLLGHERIAAEPGAAAALGELCSRLPLALRVAAAGLAAQPQYRIADWVARLRRGDRLAELDVPGDRAATVTAVLELSYLRLPASTRRMFRLLGLVPGKEITAAPAAALAGVTAAEAARMLAALAGANLMEGPLDGGYSCHDLLRRFAATRAEAAEPDADRVAATTRYFAYYLATAGAARMALEPHSLRLPSDQPTDPSEPVAATIDDPDEAYAWLEAERGNLTTIIRHTAEHGPCWVAWRLTDAVRSYLTFGPNTPDVLIVAEAARTAAAADANPLAQANALFITTAMLLQQGSYRAAEEAGDRAWQLIHDTDWIAGQSVARNLLGMICAYQGRLQEAVDHYLTALTRCERIGWLHGQATVVGNLATVFLDLGQLHQAAEYASRAIAVFAQLGSTVNGAHSRIDLGEACHFLGRLDQATEHFRDAQEQCRAAGSQAGAAEAMRGLALVHADLGQLQLAEELAERSVRAIQELGDQRLEPHCLATLADIRHRLNDLPAAVVCYRKAVDVAAETGDRYLENLALIGLASVHPPPGGYELCRKRAGRALDSSRQLGYRLLEGRALAALARIDLATGDTAAAARRWRRAHDIFTSIGAGLAADDVAAQLNLATAGPGDGLTRAGQ